MSRDNFNSSRRSYSHGPPDEDPFDPNIDNDYGFDRPPQYAHARNFQREYRSRSPNFQYGREPDQFRRFDKRYERSPPNNQMNNYDNRNSWPDQRRSNFEQGRQQRSQSVGRFSNNDNCLEMKNQMNYKLSFSEQKFLICSNRTWYFERL